MPDSWLTLLPADLAARSLSRTEIVLPLEDAVRAVQHLATEGRRIESWDGWVQFADGGRTHSLVHTGSFALPMDAAESARTTVAQMQAAQAKWNRMPEYPGASLFFCVSPAAV